MIIRFVEEAEREFLEAVSEYELARRGLGQRFRKGVEQCITWVSKNPELYRVRHGSYRRINLHVFPYFIAFISSKGILWIVAIGHASRRPLYWISRRKNLS